MHPQQADSLVKHKLSHTKAIKHNNNFTASTTTELMKEGLSRGPHPYNQNDIAHTLHELTNEGKLISGHALDIMEGTNWDYYAQKNESR